MPWLGEHKWPSVLVKEHGFGIEEAVTFASFSASRVYRDFHPLPISERDSRQGEVNGIDLDESGTLIRLFARAREWTRLLETGAFGDVKELAEGLKMDRPYVIRVLRLANLSPKILRAVIAKTLPDDFSTERLFNIKSDLWSEQEREIGLA